MLNKSGRETLLVIILTSLITILMCYIFGRVSVFKDVLEDGIETKTNNYTKLDKVKAIIDKSYLNEYDDEKLMDATIAGMLEGLDDPYAAYYNESAFESFYTKTEGEYEGIGIYVAYDSEKKMPIIITPIINSPAAEAGIMMGDYIEYVDDLISTQVTYDELVDAIKGKVGTKVKIGLLRFNEDKDYEEIELEIERKKIDVNPIIESVYEDNIGYIKLTSFDGVAYEDFKRKYENLINEKNVKGLIIDLRNNPGGVLEICAKITDLLIPKGKIVYTLDKSGKEEALFSDETQIEIPLVILVNEGSASASEVLTGAVKDYGVGKIVCTKTY